MIFDDPNLDFKVSATKNIAPAPYSVDFSDVPIVH